MKTIIYIIVLVAAFTANAKDIQFPKSFACGAKCFPGMELAAIPEAVQLKYGIQKNPDIITNPAATKGLLASGKLPGVMALYFEIYEDVTEPRMDAGFEVAQFATVSDMEKVLSHLDPRNRGMAYLTLDRYLIIVYCDGYKDYAARIDMLIAHFKNTLGATLYQDRRKDDRNKPAGSALLTSVPDPHIVQPESVFESGFSGDTILLTYNQIKGVREQEDRLSYMADKKYNPMPAGHYKVLDKFDHYAFFTLTGNGLLHGPASFSGEHKYSEAKYEYAHGVLQSEVLLQNGDTFLFRKLSIKVYKDKAENYLTTLTELKRNYRYQYQDSISTVFRNRKPVLKVRYRNHKLATCKNFETRSFEQYGTNGELEHRYAKDFEEWYDGNGEIKKRETYKDGIHETWENGNLRRRSVYIKAKDRLIVTIYDDHGKVISENSELVTMTPMVANPDEYESDLNEATFQRYKKMYRPVKANRK